MAREIDFRQPQFFALIQQDRAAQGKQQRQHHFRGAFAEARRRCASRHGWKKRSPANGRDGAPEFPDVPGSPPHRRPAAAQNYSRHAGPCRTAGSSRNARTPRRIPRNTKRSSKASTRRRITSSTALFSTRLESWTWRCMFAAAAHSAGPRIARGNGRIILQPGVMQKGIGDIEAKAVDAPRQPQIQHIQRRFARALVAPVQLGLLAQEFVMVILPPRRLIGPGRAAEHRQPIVRRRAVILGIGPDIPVPPVRIAIAAGGEPGMFVGGMRQHLVEHDFQTPRMRGFDQRRGNRRACRNRDARPS